MVGASFDTRRAIEAQREFCLSRRAPFFAPSFDGRCFFCGENVFKGRKMRGAVVGVSVEEAGASHITACPFCHRSFVE